jgi:hypothetical protein
LKISLRCKSAKCKEIIVHIMCFLLTWIAAPLLLATRSKMMWTKYLYCLYIVHQRCCRDIAEI